MALVGEPRSIIWFTDYGSKGKIRSSSEDDLALSNKCIVLSYRLQSDTYRACGKRRFSSIFRYTSAMTSFSFQWRVYRSVNRYRPSDTDPMATLQQYRITAGW